MESDSVELSARMLPPPGTPWLGSLPLLPKSLLQEFPRQTEQCACLVGVKMIIYLVSRVWKTFDEASVNVAIQV